jgi:hypothetical protein
VVEGIGGVPQAPPVVAAFACVEVAVEDEAASVRRAAQHPENVEAIGEHAELLHFEALFPKPLVDELARGTLVARGAVDVPEVKSELRQLILVD